MIIHIINGPNLNLTGKREPEIYGHDNFDALLVRLNEKYPEHQFEYFQSNVEGEIINRLHEVGFTADGIIINPGGYSHTSVAIADAVSAVTSTVIEVHLSNIYSREEFRHVSLTGAKCKGVISGFGMKGYEMAAGVIVEK